MQVMLPVMVIMVFDGIIRQPETTFQPYLILFYFIVDTTWLLADPGAVRRCDCCMVLVVCSQSHRFVP